MAIAFRKMTMFASREDVHAYPEREGSRRSSKLVQCENIDNCTERVHDVSHTPRNYQYSSSIVSLVRSSRLRPFMRTHQGIRFGVQS